MKLLKECVEAMRFDRRLVGRKQGATPEQMSKHISKLPDVEKKASVCVFQQPEPGQR